MIWLVLVVPTSRKCSRGKARGHEFEANLGHTFTAANGRHWRGEMPMQYSYMILMYEVLKKN